MTEPAAAEAVARDRGSTSLAVVLTAPLLLALMFLAFQATLWNHARTTARVIANETAVLVARDHTSPSAAAAQGRASLVAAGLDDADVSVSVTSGRVVVSVRVAAPGIIRGTSTSITVQAAVPVAAWSSL